jgi:NADH-quinone oxidoreductase subunit H
MTWMLLLEWVIKSLVVIFALLGGFAYLTWFERRVLARMQVRIGPNRAGPFGLLQPIADAVKLIFKEELTPAQALKFIFVLAPIVTVIPAVVVAGVVPWGGTAEFFGHSITLYLADLNVGVLYIAAITSIAVYGIVLAGWSSSNKFALLGGLRSTAQMVSYELALGLMFVTSVVLSGTMNTLEIVEKQRSIWFFVIQPVGGFIFLIATLAEVNRAPFDMPEAEQELGAGYHSEYSGMKFALFFMAEYTKMIAICAIAATLFFGGYLGPDISKLPFVGQYLTSFAPWMGPVYLLLKVVALLFGMVWIRATLPRIRYDRLMSFGWKVLLPLSLAVVMISAVGVMLAQEVNPMLIWIVPVASLLVGSIFLVILGNSIRRKLYV